MIPFTIPPSLAELQATEARALFLDHLRAAQAKARQVGLMLEAADSRLTYYLDIGEAKRLAEILTNLLASAPQYVPATTRSC